MPMMLEVIAVSANTTEKPLPEPDSSAAELRSPQP